MATKIKNNIIQKIYKKITSYKKVTIFGHLNIDNDCYGSCLAMCYFLRSMKIDARIIGTETITSKEVLKQVDNSLPIPDEKFVKSSLGIVLDLGTKKNLVSELFDLCKESVRIDHHPKIETFCDLEWVDTNYCSTCEMVGWFIQWTNKAKMSKEIANALYVGILTDSGNLLYPSARASAYDLVSSFFKYNFDKQQKQQELYLKDKQDVIANNKLFKHIKFLDDGIAYLVITPRMQKKYKLNKTDNKIFLMANMKEVKVWFSLYWSTLRNSWKVSIRSREYPVRQVAMHFGGGGHELASGFSINSLSEIDEIITQIKKMLYS